MKNLVDMIEEYGYDFDEYNWRLVDSNDFEQTLRHNDFPLRIRVRKMGEDDYGVILYDVSGQYETIIDAVKHLNDELVVEQIMNDYIYKTGLEGASDKQLVAEMEARKMIKMQLDFDIKHDFLRNTAEEKIDRLSKEELDNKVDFLEAEEVRRVAKNNLYEDYILSQVPTLLGVGFEEAPIWAWCPNCDKEFDTTIKLKGDTVTCPSCGQELEWEGI